MPNRPRPRCQKCERAMDPLFAKRERGKTTMRIRDIFWCRACSVLAKGRDNAQYIA